MRLVYEHKGITKKSRENDSIEEIEEKNLRINVLKFLFARGN